MNNYTHTEFDEIRRDAGSSEGKTFAQRTAMFEGLMDLVDALQGHLSAEERIRRMRIAGLLDPRPNPWWRNFREEALANYQCQNSST
jgi:hypothetical protein